MNTDISRSHALKFIVLMGIVSMFADMTYEGARSITGPYLGVLGANAAIVGFVAGFGEFFGYSVRLFSGYFSDRTHRYWLIAIIGYVVNLAAVPLLALAGNWWVAGILIILERAGKGIRVPARDAMLSHAVHKTGVGWGFGLHEALDQTGAMIGPLFVTYLLYVYTQYHYCFAWLTLPAIACVTALFLCYSQYPNPQTMEQEEEDQLPQINLSGLKKNMPFWIYLAGATLVAMGYADFALIAYHFGKIHLMSPLWIPVTYACALGSNIIMSPLLGFLYDRVGFIVLFIVTIFAAFFAPLVFFGNELAAVIGCIIWGIGFGAQGSLMRAIVAQMTPKEKRGSAYGVFNAVFGFGWFIGSAVMGVLYDISLTSLVVFSVITQLLSLPLLWKAMRLSKI